VRELLRGPSREETVAEGCRLRANEPGVICEMFPDGESVIVNLETGIYYSTIGVGSFVWSLLPGHPDESAIVSSIARRYSTSPAEIAPGVRVFIQELEREGLIVRAADEGDRSSRPDAPSGGKPDDALRYEAPVLNKYSDMKDLLVLDPIHEVDTSGWPARRRESKPS
jgi:hypothetical protein